MNVLQKSLLASGMLFLLLIGSSTAHHRPGHTRGPKPPISGGSGEITAASCSQGDVQSAINVIDATTTRINIPAGTCHWTAGVILNMPIGIGPLSVIGAGNLSGVGGGDATVIIDDIADGGVAVWAVYQFEANLNVFRIAGLTIETGTGPQKNGGFLSISTTNDGWPVRVDHNHFVTTNNTASLRANNVIGVYDHNLVDHAAVYISRSGSDQSGDAQWALSTRFGTADFFFIEDNTFVTGGANDCDHGGRQVIRYNTVASVQTHPTGGAGRARGCRASEVYGNTFTATGAELFNTFFLSNGAALVWNNQAIAAYTNFITLHSMRKNNNTYTQVATPNGWGYCGTAFNGAGSNWDENSDVSTGYVCFDQPGQGQGDLLSGNFNAVPANGVINTATGCNSSQSCAWPRQALEPVYEWLNTSPVATYNVFEPTVLVENRDYYVYTESFTGATGIGSGLLASRPATCTPKVSYWATDTAALYQCTSTNTWTVYYIPYQYPHPLNVTAPSSFVLPPGGSSL